MKFYNNMFTQLIKYFQKEYQNDKRKDMMFTTFLLKEPLFLTY